MSRYSVGLLDATPAIDQGDPYAITDGLARLVWQVAVRIRCEDCDAAIPRYGFDSLRISAEDLERSIAEHDAAVHGAVVSG